MIIHEHDEDEDNTFEKRVLTLQPINIGPPKTAEM